MHRRPDDVSRFPGGYNWLIGGAVGVGEAYEDAAARELAEELGVRGRPRFVFKYLCSGAISPYWLGLHEVTVAEPVVPDTAEIVWRDWLTEAELTELVRHPAFVPDARDAYARHRALTGPSGHDGKPG